MKQLIFVLAILTLSLDVRAACTGSNFSINSNNGRIAATFQTSDYPAALIVDTPVKLTIGNTELETKVTAVQPTSFVPPTTIVTLEGPSDVDFENGSFEAELATDAAQLSYEEGNETKTVDLCLVGQFNTMSSHLSVGPAVAEDDQETEAGDEDNDAPSAWRLQYQRSYRRFRAFGRDDDTTKIPSERRGMQEFSVSIDTTDEKDEGFVDDNRVMGGYFLPRRSFGAALNRVRVGVAGEHARALHGGAHNSDLKVSLEGGIPFLRAANIATPQPRLGLPLQFRVSAGRRWQNVEDAKGDGNLGEVSFLYHAYLLAQYRIDVEHRTIFNDISNRPASTPRTQHSWKASVYFMGDDESGFSAVASYENGHSGPVFTQLRQFFVGVGLKDALTRIGQ